MLEICKLVFDEFEKNNICYCHWKSNEHLDEGLNGRTDLDILVNIDQKEKCEEILHNCKVVKVISPLGNVYKYVNDWIGMDNNTCELIHLHIHYRIVTGKQYRKEFVLPWDKLMLKTRVKAKKSNVYIANPNIEIVILYTRILLKVKYEEEKSDTILIDNDYLKEIRYLKKMVSDSTIKKFLNCMFRKEVSDFFSCLFKEKFTKDEYVKYKKIILCNIDKYKIESKSQTYLSHKVLKTIVNTKEYLKSHGVPFITKKCPNKEGIVIALIGTDGSGKSTMTKNIQAWLNWKIETQRFYLGSGDGYKKPISYNFYTNESLPKSIREYFGMVFYLKLSMNIYKTLNKVKKYREKGGIALLDRFPQIQFYGINDGPKIKSKIDSSFVSKKYLDKFINYEEKKYKKIVLNQPNVVFKLNISPEEAIKRKRENTLAEMRQKVSIVENLKFLDSNVYEIDATKNINEEILEIKRIIWQEIYQRQ